MGAYSSTQAKVEKKTQEEKFAEKPQANVFLTRLFDCFKTLDFDKAEDTAKLLKTLYGGEYNPDCTFAGSLFYDRKVASFQHGYYVAKDYILFHKDGSNYHNDHSKSIYVDGVKPYLLAYFLSRFNKQWLDVFSILYSYSNCDIRNDKIFGVSFYDLFLKTVTGNGTAGYIHLNLTWIRKTFRGVVFDSLETMARFIDDNEIDLITIIFEVCDCKQLLQQHNFLINIVSHKEDRTRLIPLFIAQGEDVMYRRLLDNRSVPELAVHWGKSQDYLYLVRNYDILKTFHPGLLQDLYYNELTLECFTETLKKAKEAKIDIVNQKGKNGLTPLAFICTEDTTNHYYDNYQSWTNSIIKALILEGADIYEKVDGKRIVDLLFEWDYAKLVGQMIEWRDQYIKSIAPPAPPPVIGV